MTVNEKPPQEKYLDAKYVVDNPNGFDHRDVARAQEYVNGFEDALSVIEKAVDDQIRFYTELIEEEIEEESDEDQIMIWVAKTGAVRETLSQIKNEIGE